MAPLRRYVQGRYHCLKDGSFTVTAYAPRPVKQRYPCPACRGDATLIAECRGQSSQVTIGVTDPMQRDPDQLGSWYDSHGVHRASKNARHGGRPRKQERCEPCDAPIYASMAGANYAADIAAIRYRRQYVTVACPHGNGCHVFRGEGQC